MESRMLIFLFHVLLGLLVQTNAKAIIQIPLNEENFQLTLERRSPQLYVQSQGYGGGPNGVGMSSTQMSMNDDPDNSSDGLNVQSNALGYGNNGGISSTSLQFSNGNNGRALNVNSNAAGGGNGGGMSATSLQFNNDDNDGTNIETNAVGVGGNDGGYGATQTSFQYNDKTDDVENNNGGLNVQAEAVGVGSGNNGGGLGTTSIQAEKDGTVTDVQSIGIGVGNEGGVGASSTSLQQGGNDSNTVIDSNAVGYGNGPNAIGAAETSVHQNDSNNGETIDTQSTAIGVGNESLAASDTSLHQDNIDGTVTDVGANSITYSNGNDSDTSELQNTTVGSPAPNAGLGLSANSLHINDDEEGDININTAALASGNEGGSNVGLGIENGQNETNDNLQVQSTTEAFNNSDQGITGSSTIVQVNDEANERSIDARSLGVGFENENGTGGITAESVNYRDRDEEHQQAENIDENGITKSSTTEVSDVNIENSTTGYHFIADDGSTTHSTTTTTSQSSSYVQQQSFYSESSSIQGQQFTDQNQSSVISNQQNQDLIQGQDYVVYTDQTQNTNQNQNDIVLGQQTPCLDQGEDYIVLNQPVQNVDQDQGYIVSGPQAQNLDQGEDYVVLNQQPVEFNQNQGYTILGQQTQNLDQNYIVSGQQTQSLDQSYIVSGQQTQSLDQSYIVSAQQTQSLDQNYGVAGQQTQNLDQGEDFVVLNQQSQNVDQDQGFTVSDLQTQGLDQGEDYIVANQQTRSLDQDQSYIKSGQQTQSVDQSYIVESGQQTQGFEQNTGYAVTNQQTHNVDQSQNYIVTNQQTQNLNQNQGFVVSGQQTQSFTQNQEYTVSNQQTQFSQQSQDYTQQSSFGARQIDIPLVENQASPTCPDHNQGPGVVCYYHASSVFEYQKDYILYPDQIVADYCDVLVVSYAILDFDRSEIGPYSPEEERVFSEILKLKNGKLKIILQLQYVAFYEQYINLLNCDDSANQFISSIVNYLQRWNFDGIELPILVPESNDNIYFTAPIIKQKYAALVQNLKTRLQQNNLLLSGCLPIEPEYIHLAYDIPNILQYVDWFSINTVDYHVPSQGVLRHTSPLTPESLEDPFCIDYTVNYLIGELHVPADKLIINLPLYGSTFVLENYREKIFGARVSRLGPAGPGSHMDGFLTISELCSLYQFNWLNNPAIVTDYDDVPTLVMKVAYARSKCLGGVGIHAITMDDPKGHLCNLGPMPFTRAISLAYNPYRDTFNDDDDLDLINYIDPVSTNKYEA